VGGGGEAREGKKRRKEEIGEEERLDQFKANGDDRFDPHLALILTRNKSTGSEKEAGGQEEEDGSQDLSFSSNNPTSRSIERGREKLTLRKDPTTLEWRRS